MDTVRADHLGCYGYHRETSPNVDRLAERSLLFEDAISQAAWTLPGHGSMFSGLYPSRLGVTHYPALRRLPDVNPTLAETFMAAGHTTAGFTGGGFVSEHFGFDRGFEIYTTAGRRFEHNIDDAIGWLHSRTDRPFFLFFHGYDAHRPYYSEAEDQLALGLATDMPKKRKGFCLGDNRRRPVDLGRVVDHYDAAIRHGDRFVGRLLDAIDELGLGKNTVVLLTSDHGEEFYEHGHCDHVRFLYRETVAVPFIVYVPGLTPGGRRIAHAVPATISVAATLLELVGVAGKLPGLSLVSTIKGRQAPVDAVFSEADSKKGHYGSRGRTVALTTKTVRLIAYPDEDKMEAYDRANDPGEQKVLAAGDAAYLRQGELLAWAASLSPLPRPAPLTPVGRGGKAGGLPAQLEENLRSLGYAD